jgi:hypothetical protein
MFGKRRLVQVEPVCCLPVVFGLCENDKFPEKTDIHKYLEMMIEFGINSN